MKLKYVGLKDREDAFSDVTGIVWGPGVVEDIKDEELAKRMLKHPDVFELDESPNEDALTAEVPEATEEPADVEADTLESLRAEATELGVKFHHKHGIEKLRELIAAAQ
jgi:hypothetical protein